jgi:hypothetical protein
MRRTCPSDNPPGARRLACRQAGDGDCARMDAPDFAALRPAIRRLDPRPHPAVALAAALLPLLGVVLLDWPVAAMIGLYWAENVVIGLFHVGKIRAARGRSDDPAMVRALAANPDLTPAQRQAQLDTTHRIQHFIVPGVFVLHYGLFCLGHAAVVAFVFDGAFDPHAHLRLRRLQRPVRSRLPRRGAATRHAARRGRLHAGLRRRLVMGSMGAVADGALSAGGEVIGILPRFMADLEWGHPGPDPAGAGRGHARAQAPPARRLRRGGRLAGRLRHAGGAVRGDHAQAARPVLQPDRAARTPAASTRRCTVRMRR